MVNIEFIITTNDEENGNLSKLLFPDFFHLYYTNLKRGFNSDRVKVAIHYIYFGAVSEELAGI